MVGVVVLAVSGAAWAAESAATLDPTAPGTRVLDAKATPVVAAVAERPADAPHRQAITALQQERQAFVQSFDWSAGERESLRGAFQAAMERFEIRELELRRDWYQATGQTDLLARTQSSLEKRLQPARALPEIGGERRTAVQPLTPEESK